MELERPLNPGPSPGSEKKGKAMKELEKEQIESSEDSYIILVS